VNKEPIADLPQIGMEKVGKPEKRGRGMKKELSMPHSLNCCQKELIEFTFLILIISDFLKKVFTKYNLSDRIKLLKSKFISMIILFFKILSI
jgi:hypothetical protein